MPRCNAPLASGKSCRNPIGTAQRCAAGHPARTAVSAAGTPDAGASAAADPFGNAPAPAAFPNVSREDVAAGGMLGVHVGDSLGATAEFKSREMAAACYPANVEDVDIVGGGPFNWKPGDATDDTDLTQAVDDAYFACGPDASSDDVVRAAADNMLGWYRKGPRDVGGATAEGLRNYGQTRDPYSCGVTRDSGQGNGSLMRTLPVALARVDDPVVREREARAISAVTHAHPVCQDACVAYTDLGADLAARRVGTHDQLDARLEELSRDERFDPSVRKAIRDGIDLGDISDLPREQDGSGWVNYSLTVSVWAVRQRRPASEVLVDVARHGGDADTNGAIAGGLLGLRDGASAWPQRWTDKLQFRSTFRDAGADYATYWTDQR